MVVSHMVSVSTLKNLMNISKLKKILVGITPLHCHTPNMVVSRTLPKGECKELNIFMPIMYVLSPIVQNKQYGWIIYS